MSTTQMLTLSVESETTSEYREGDFNKWVFRITVRLGRRVIKIEDFTDDERARGTDRFAYTETAARERVEQKLGARFIELIDYGVTS